MPAKEIIILELTCELLTLGVDPAITLQTLNHLGLPVICAVTLMTHWTEVTCTTDAIIAVGIKDNSLTDIIKSEAKTDQLILNY